MLHTYIVIIHNVLRTYINKMHVHMATYMHAGKIAYISYRQLYIRVYVAMYQSKNLWKKYIIWLWTNTDFCLKIKMVLYIYNSIYGYFVLMNVLLECIDH